MDNANTDVIYVALTGLITDDMVKRVIAGFSVITLRAPREVHLLLHSPGGNVGDAVFLHNFLRNLPFDVIAYNAGTVASAAITVYLGGKRRVASEGAVFMLHRVSAFPPQNISTEALAAVATSVDNDNARTEAILRRYADIPESTWEKYLKGDLHIMANEAVQFKLAQELGNFTPPLGAQVFQI